MTVTIPAERPTLEKIKEVRDKNKARIRGYPGWRSTSVGAFRDATGTPYEGK